MNRSGINMFDPPVGLLKKGTIVAFNSVEFTMEVQLNDASSMKGRNPITVTVPAPHSLFFNNGLYIGSLPAKGTPVIVGEGRGGQYFFVSFFSENVSAVPSLTLGELLIQSTEQSFITLDLNSNIVLGSNVSNIHISPGNSNTPKSNYITLNFESENHITQGTRSVTGIIKRDLKYNNQFDPDTKYENDAYDPFYKIVGMDPTTASNDISTGSLKNPPLVESRELIYEYQYESNVDDDVSESNKYVSNPQIPVYYSAPNRRKSRADTLSLSLVSPNYLMENVKGTVVDIFGNILDINRSPLPVGKDTSTTLKSDVSTNQKQSYINIRALERKGIAYHFEMNARKDPSPQILGNPNLDIKADNYNAKLQRSRFFFDIDKEGQIKLNVPASSETGNVPLLLRYENYSTFGPEDNGNPNKLWSRKDIDNLDIFVDSFAALQQSPSSNSAGSVSGSHGSITLLNGNSNAGPIDRISQFVDNNPTHIKHGTAYHDILQICTLQQNSLATLSNSANTTPNPITFNYIQPLTNMVSTEIRVSGTGLPSQGGPNAGGRSGSFNFDGSLDLNIGANTVDRQSLWIDTAGGLVGMFGRDLNQRSALLNFDGDVIMQIGGPGISSDARFDPGLSVAYNAVLDLRVYQGAYCHMIRMDQNGMTFYTPGKMSFKADQGIQMESDGAIFINSDNLFTNERQIVLLPNKSI